MTHFGYKQENDNDGQYVHYGNSKKSWKSIKNVNKSGMKIFANKLFVYSSPCSEEAPAKVRSGILQHAEA